MRNSPSGLPWLIAAQLALISPGVTVAENLFPPVAPQVEHISTWHGEKVNDPYFWLREKTNSGVVQYLEDESKLRYSTDTTGFRQFNLYRKDPASGAITGPLAERVTSAAWTADNRHVFYVTEDEVTKRSDRLWRLDLDGGKPEPIYEEKD